MPVLITGETGTGKTLLARIIHEQGDRRRAPFVPVNCAGVPEGLFESEFFGHRRGAFTGALDSRRGLIESAHEGTLFLDEVADLPLAQQAKLLTVIEDRRVRRVGEERPVEVDVRLISATSVDVPAALADGRFRADLYHRIALLRCTLPPLRERPEDILFLAEALMGELALKHGHDHPSLSPQVRDRLVAHLWPGNVRELAHVLEASLILSDGAPLELSHIQEVLDYLMPADTSGRGIPGGDTDAAEGRGLPDIGSPLAARGRENHSDAPASERERIREVLERHAGDRSRAALELGISRTTLRTRILRYGLTSPQ